MDRGRDEQGVLIDTQEAFWEELTTIHGVMLSLRSDRRINVTQQKKILELLTPTTEESFSSQYVLIQYIGVNCRSDIYATIQWLAPTNKRIDIP